MLTVAKPKSPQSPHSLHSLCPPYLLLDLFEVEHLELGQPRDDVQPGAAEWVRVKGGITGGRVG